MPVKNIRDAVCDDGPRCARSEVRRQVLDIAEQEILVVGSHDAHIECGVGALEALQGLACIFQGLVDRLENQPLEWVDGLGFDRLDAEEARVKETEVFIQKIRMTDIGSSVVVAVTVVKGVNVKAVYLLELIRRLLQEVPELGRGAGLPRKPTATPDDGDWLARDLLSGDHADGKELVREAGSCKCRSQRLNLRNLVGKIGLSVERPINRRLPSPYRS